LILTLVAGVTVISATAAGAAPRRSAPLISQTVPCYAGPSAGPIDVNEQSDITSYTIGATTIESGTIRLTNLANGHAATFHEAGTVTRIGVLVPPGTGASADYVIDGSVIWASRGDLSYILGTATTDGGRFNQITSHTGALSEACEAVA